MPPIHHDGRALLSSCLHESICTLSSSLDIYDGLEIDMKVHPLVSEDGGIIFVEGARFHRKKR